MKKYYIPPVLYGASDIRIDEVTNSSVHRSTEMLYVEVNGVAKFYTDKSNIYDKSEVKKTIIKRTKDLKKMIDKRLDSVIEGLENE